MAPIKIQQSKLTVSVRAIGHEQRTKTALVGWRARWLVATATTRRKSARRSRERPFCVYATSESARAPVLFASKIREKSAERATARLSPSRLLLPPPPSSSLQMSLLLLRLLRPPPSRLRCRLSIKAAAVALVQWHIRARERQLRALMSKVRGARLTFLPYKMINNLVFCASATFI